MIGQATAAATPWSTAAPLAIVSIASGIVLVWIGRRAVRGTLPRNRLAGIRTRATLDSDAAWEAGHRAGGGLIIWIGALWLGLGAVVLLRPSESITVVLMMAVFALTMVCAVASTVRANRAATELLE